ncbi:MAG: ATP-binding response regulator [bacterium]
MKEKILIVDDEESVRNILYRTLSGEGYSCELSEDGIDALKKVGEGHFDAVLTDIMMPGMDGLELLRRIKKLDDDIVVIVLTGYGSMESAVEAMRWGASDYITKPIPNLDSVEIALRRSIENRNIRRELAALKRVNKMKDDFLSIVFHELYTPLTSVKASLSLLSGGHLGDLNDEQKKVLNILKEESGRLGHIISRVLLMAELQSGDVDLSWGCVDARDIVAGVLASFRGEIEAAHLRVECSGLKDLPPLHCDGKHIRVVFENLVENAVKFNREGGWVSIRARREGDWAEFEVSDGGIGIAPENLERIFDKFQQVEDPMTRKVGGLGLGLSISRRIVELHGGRIWAESEPGEQTSFKFTLPLHEAPHAGVDRITKTQFKTRPTGE